MVISKTDLEHARLYDFALVDGLRLSGCNYPSIVHTLDSNIVQVLTTQSTRIERIPRGGDGCKRLHVVGITARVEDEPGTDSLEERKVAAGLFGLLINIVVGQVVLIGLQHVVERVARCHTRHTPVELKGNETPLQFLLLQCELANPGAVFRSADLVIGTDVGPLCMNGHGLG